MEQANYQLLQEILSELKEGMSNTKKYGILEKAYYKYIDEMMEMKNSDLTLKDFVAMVAMKDDNAKSVSKYFDLVEKKFIVCQRKIKRCGAVILDADLRHILLVRGFDSNSDWSFPMGKVEKGESAFNCARREVAEETGLTLDQAGHRETIRFQHHEVVLFIGWGVARSVHIAPQVFGEIMALW